MKSPLSVGQKVVCRVEDVKVLPTDSKGLSY